MISYGINLPNNSDNNILDSSLFMDEILFGWKSIK